MSSRPSTSLLRLLHHHRLFRSFSSLSSNPDPTTPKRSSSSPLRSTVNSILKEADLDKLVAEFSRSSDHQGFRNLPSVYEISVRRLAGAGRLDAVESLIDDQKRRYLSSEGFASRLISLYTLAGMPSHAAKLFSELPALLKSPPTALSFNALLTALTRARDAPRIARLLRNPPCESIVPNVISYNIFALALCEAGELDQALDVLDLMENNGVAPNLITFNTLLNGLYSTDGRFEDAEKVWTKMCEKNITPDVRSYNAKVRGLASKGKISEAVGLIEELRSIGLKPDGFTFTALIKGYCKDEKLDEAKNIYVEMVRNGLAPTRTTFEILIPRLCKAGDLDMALKLCNTSISQRCFVGVRVFQEVADSLARASRFEEAKRLVEHGKLKSYARKNLRMPLPCLAV